MQYSIYCIYCNPADSKNVRIGLDEIAASSSIELRQLSVRLTPNAIGQSGLHHSARSTDHLVRVSFRIRQPLTVVVFDRRFRMRPSDRAGIEPKEHSGIRPSPPTIPETGRGHVA